MSKPKYKAGQKVGNKLVIRFISSTGNKHWYLIQCLKCGKQRGMLEVSIEKRAGCKLCSFSHKCRKYPTVNK